MTAPGPGVETPEEVPPRRAGQPLGAPGGTSHRGWSTASVLAFCIAGALLFLALLGPAERGVCALNHDQIRYCTHYDTEPAR